MLVSPKDRLELALEWYSRCNRTVFRGQLPQGTEKASGGEEAGAASGSPSEGAAHSGRTLEVSWNPRLRRTAGLTYTWGRGGCSLAQARIELSTKVLTDRGRLRQTLLHEMCHAAAWVVNGCRKPPHGAVFRKWGAAAG